MKLIHFYFLFIFLFYCTSLNSFSQYEIGDILLKIKTPRRLSCSDTYHHTMLVIGTSQNGNPIIAHMKFPIFEPKNPGIFLIETLNKAKSLHLLHPHWSKKFKEALAQFVKSLKKEKSDFFTMTRTGFTKKVSSTHSKSYTLSFLKREFKKMKTYFSLLKSEMEGNGPVDLICHDFVVKVLHYVSMQTKEPIPEFLKMFPERAWSYKLLVSAKADKSVRISQVTLHQSTSVKNKKKQEAPRRKSRAYKIKKENQIICSIQ